MLPGIALGDSEVFLRGVYSVNDSRTRSILRSRDVFLLTMLIRLIIVSTVCRSPSHLFFLPLLDFPRLFRTNRSVGTSIFPLRTPSAPVHPILEQPSAYHSTVPIMRVLIFQPFCIFNTTGYRLPACARAYEMPFLGLVNLAADEDLLGL
jgi:hypothetical protein